MLSVTPLQSRPGKNSGPIAVALVLCLTFVVIGLATFAYVGHRKAAQRAPGDEAREVFFTPGDETTKEIVALLDAAKQTVHVQAYFFTAAPIAKAVVEAKRRGVDVTVVLDTSQQTANYSSADFLAMQACRCSSTRNTPSRTTKS